MTDFLDYKLLAAYESSIQLFYLVFGRFLLQLNCSILSCLLLYLDVCFDFLLRDLASVFWVVFYLFIFSLFFCKMTFPNFISSHFFSNTKEIIEENPKQRKQVNAALWQPTMWPNKKFLTELNPLTAFFSFYFTFWDKKKKKSRASI